MRVLALVFVFTFALGCPPEECSTTADAGVAGDAGMGDPGPSLTHPACFAGMGFHRCARVSCRDPFDGRVLVDQRGEPLEPRCGDDGVPSCWGVLRPFEEPVEVELVAEGVEYVWCEERP